MLHVACWLLVVLSLESDDDGGGAMVIILFSSPSCGVRGTNVMSSMTESGQMIKPHIANRKSVRVSTETFLLIWSRIVSSFESRMFPVAGGNSGGRDLSFIHHALAATMLLLSPW